ncbi:hypothetical protein [Phenylobacterium sp.]|uniref:hypothetical protein n=1 Tax=Phenylobacterium sp. TaxID=1871053 RepID=UPI002F94EDF3
MKDLMKNSVLARDGLFLMICAPAELNRSGRMLDLRRLTPFGVRLTGACVALAAGLLLGGAMKPELLSENLVSGPQQLSGRSGVRAIAAADDGAAMAAYRGNPPHYVLGLGPA